MKQALRTSIAFLLAGLLDAHAAPYKLFLLAGQSNMDDCGLWNDLAPELQSTPANVKLRDIRGKTGEPNLPVVMGRISSSLLKKTPWNFDHARIVQQAQESVAASDAHAFLIHTDDLTTLEDNTHFDSKAQLTLGKKMATLMLGALDRGKSEMRSFPTATSQLRCLPN